MYGARARIGSWNAEVNVFSSKRNTDKIKKKIIFIFVQQCYQTFTVEETSATF